MPQVKMKAKLGASLVQPKSRGTPRLPPPARPGAPPATEPDPLSSEALAGSGIFFQKGVASAVGFRPTQWTYERETEDAAPPLSLSSAPRLAVLPGGAAEPAKPPLPSASLLQIETPPPRLTLLPPAAEEPAAEAVAAKVVALAPVAPAPSARAETRGSAPLGSAEIEALLAARDEREEGGVEPQPVAVAPAAPATPTAEAPSEP